VVWIDSADARFDRSSGQIITNLYASGTRTVRGLEALSLSVPPTPGQSIVKRPDNERMFNWSTVMRDAGYTPVVQP